jgi:hypothetical protein
MSLSASSTRGAGAHLRLASDNAAPAATARSEARAAKLREAVRPVPYSPPPADDGSGDMPALYAPCGDLLPPLHRFRRIRLDTHRATKAWRALAGELEAATDALAAAVEEPGADVDAAYAQWREVAARALDYRTPRISDMRRLIALAAILAGERFAHGGLEHFNTRNEAVFAMLDRAAFRVAMAHEKGGR